MFPGPKSEEGLQRAINEFLAFHPEWMLREHIPTSNGLTVLERRMVITSIIIPTCGKNWQSVLQSCLEAVFQWTKLDDKEVIVVANGAPAEALAYLRTKPVQILDFPERLGYIRAVNVGIKAAKGERIILLDDDSFLMPQYQDYWVDLLKKPFEEDPKMGAAGPFGQTYDDLGQVLHSGCTMYKRSVIEEIGLLDEAFNPGYMGDEDLAIRIRKAGYNLELVPKGSKPKYVDGTFQIAFPVIHTGSVNTMDKHGADLPLVAKNRKLLLERHGHVLAAAPYVGPKISIIIPTYKDNVYTDEKTGESFNILRKNLETLALYTDLVGKGVEVIVVCNGCVDGQEAYVNSLGPPFRAISFPDAIGYTRATNEGIKVAKGEFLIFYNDDVVLLPQAKNQWLDWLLEPFQNNPKMGITGPLQLHDDYANQDVIIGFCLCIKKSVLDDIGGGYDEIYSPGGGEDIDLCCKARAKGYVVRQVPDEGKLGFSHTNTGRYPVWHINNRTFRDIEEYTRWYVKRNGWINCKRYNRNIKLNLGSGGIEYPGFLSVDLHDRRATIIQDITKLDFEPNSVTEMIAIHVIEHLSPYVVLDTLKLWFKLLKPGGKLTMELPDLESLCERYLKANTGQRYGLTNCIFGSVNTTSEGQPSDITSPHLYGWDKQMIQDHLWNAGFRRIEFMPERFPHPEPPNMSVDAYKPLKPEA